MSPPYINLKICDPTELTVKTLETIMTKIRKEPQKSLAF
jgi:hypothetical protein